MPQIKRVEELEDNDLVQPSIRGSIELLSEDVQEIISYRPHWFIRKGNIIFLSVIFALSIFAYLIKYPDIINGTVKLTAANAPKLHDSKINGRLERLLVKNGENVKQGQELAYLQSSGRHEEILKLEEWIYNAESMVKEERYGDVVLTGLPVFTDLGELQSIYQDFETIYKEIKQLLSNGYYQQKKSALQKDIQYLNKLNDDARQQQQLVMQDQGIQEREYEVYEQLASEKVIAPNELNQYKSKLLSKQQTLSQASSQITNTEIGRHRKQQELLDLNKSEMDVRQAFVSAFFDLKSKIGEWRQKFIITASETGRLEFISFLQERQLVSNNEPLFFIQPVQSGYFAEMKVGQFGIGKMKEGQRVIIRLGGYPSSEFGFVEGKVSFISNLPNERDSFLVRLDLPNGLKTSYSKQIVFRNNLSATAEVITDDRRLIERLFGQMRQISKR